MELRELMERGAELRLQSQVTRAESKRLRSAVRPYLQGSHFYLLAIAEHLIEAHRIAKREEDGATIDVIQDALVFVGRRLARETKADGRSARTILGGR